MKTQQLCERYVTVWNEPDADARRRLIRELWARDGCQVLTPPQDIRAGASALAMTATLEAHGHDALESRVARAYDDFVASGKYRFRASGDGRRLRDVVVFRWEMIAAESGEVAGGGLEVLVLDDDGLIRADYQFIA